jgi:hypothetical protein
MVGSSQFRILLGMRKLGLRSALLLFLITAGFYWRLTLTNQYTWLNGPDLARQVLPWIQFQVGEIQRGRVPLWDPYQLGGQPLLAQAQPGTAYPLNWILYSLPTRRGWVKAGTMHWYFVVIHFLAVAFAYWLCRDQRLGRLPSTLGGVLFGLGGYLGVIDWPQMMNGAVWAPLILMFVLRALRGERVLSNAAWGGLCLGLSILSGHHQVPLYLGLMAAGLWIWGMVGAGRINFGLARAVALFFVVTVLVSGLQSLPAWEYSKHAVRWVGLPGPVGHSEVIPYTIHEHYSLRPHLLFTLFIPGFEEGSSAYTGSAAILLAILGAATAWSRSPVRIATAIAVGGGLFALGGDVVFHGVLYSLIPALDKARSPSMATVVLQLGLALMAAHCLEERSDAWQRRVQKAAVVFAAVVFSTWYAQALFKTAGWRGDSRVVTGAVLVLLMAAVLRGWRSGALQGASTHSLLLAIVLVQLGHGGAANHAHRLNGFRELDALREDHKVAEAVRKLPPGRVGWPNQDVHSFGDWIGLDAWDGSAASVTSNQYVAGFTSTRFQELFGVRYMIAKQPRDGWVNPVGTIGEEWRIYENPSAFPAAWTVHGVRKVSREEIRTVYSQAEWNPRQTALTWDPVTDVEVCSGDDVFLLRRVSNEVHLWAEMRCRGMVILSDTYYPGWKVTVDGHPARLDEVNGCMRGVVVPAGAHRIVMRYRPASFYLGAVMSVLGVVLVFVVRRFDAAA